MHMFEALNLTDLAQRPGPSASAGQPARPKTSTAASGAPRQGQTAYQRWELAALLEDGSPAPERPLSLKEAEQRQEELERTAGYQAGFAAGLEAGLAEGNRRAALEAAHAQAAQAQAAAEALTELLREARAELDQFRLGLPQDVLALSTRIAETMLRAEIAQRPERLLEPIRQAIEALPSLQAPLTLRLGPGLQARLPLEAQQSLAQEGWRLVLDASLPSEGCQLETADHQLDASLDLRIEAVRQALLQPGDQAT